MLQRLFLLSRVLLVSLTMVLLASAASAQNKSEYFVDETKLPFAALPGATATWGVHAGAGYRAEYPDNWNGTLVMWAHGFRGTGLELTVDNHPLRALLIPLGFAWASSSYTTNDYDVKAGVKSTHALAALMNDQMGEASRV
jgi:hypothetical protein